MRSSKLPNFSVEYLKSILFYDPWTGDWTWKVNRGQGKNACASQKAGYKEKNGYWRISINNRLYQAHLLAWYYMTGKWPLKDIDHQNEIKDDNRFENLRLATSSQQKANTSMYKNNTSGYKGVYWREDTQKWTAQIYKNRKRYILGYFLIPEDAARAYDKKALELFGLFAKLNFPNTNLNLVI